MVAAYRVPTYFRVIIQGSFRYRTSPRTSFRFASTLNDKPDSTLVNKERVILLHGFLGFSYQGQLIPLATTLKKQGFSVSVFSYPSRRDTMLNHARTLVDLLDSLCTRETQPFHFVTHSLGAIVLRLALSLRECPENAKLGRLVLLAPPLKGSKFARSLKSSELGGKLPKWLESIAKLILGDCTGKQLVEMSPQDEKLFHALDFDSMPAFPGTCKILGQFNPLLGNINDGVLEVEETWLQQPHYRLVVRGTHNTLLFQPDVMENTVKFLCGKDIIVQKVLFDNNDGQNVK
eukprot:jgi/Galph1/5356/GphlegSOOS_G3936.1